jgi:hypothetical protein
MVPTLITNALFSLTLFLPSVVSVLSVVKLLLLLAYLANTFITEQNGECHLS